MKTQDGRKLNPKTLEEIRTRAVQRVQAGESPEIVIKTLGFSRACIYNWLARYRAGGWHALKTGNRTGRPKKLTGSQMRWIYKTVVDKNPLQMKFQYALWTRAMIAVVIRKRLGIRLSESSVGRLLRQLGLTFQKPLYRAYQQNPEAVAEWKANHDRKKLEKRAERAEKHAESCIELAFYYALAAQAAILEAAAARQDADGAA